MDRVPDELWMEVHDIVHEAVIKTIPKKKKCKKTKWLSEEVLQIAEKRRDVEYSLEGLMLKLKLQYFGHLIHWKRP